MQRFSKDLAFGFRTLRKAPLTSLAVAGTLAVATAAVGVAFALLDGFFLRPLPVREPERLVRIYTSFPGGPRHFTVSHADYTDIRDLRAVFAGVVAEQPLPVSVGVAGEYERVWAEEVSEGYLALLGLAPALGRFFAASEHTAGGPAAVVLAHGFWQRRFGGSALALGRTLVIDGRTFTIVGVLPRGFQGTTVGLVPDLWLPLVPERTKTDRGARAFFTIGRLRSGVSVEQAAAALDLLARRLERTAPDTNEGVRFTAVTEAQGRVHPLVRGGLLGFSLMLVVVATLVLLLACANVAAVLLARGLMRRSELAVRRALGASRRDVVGLLLAESALLAALGGIGGLALTWAATRFLSTVPLPRARGAALAVDVGLDLRVVLVALLVMALTVVLSGLAPALASSRPDLVAAMKNDDSASRLRPSRLHGALVGLQVLVSLVLLLAGGLFLRSLANAGRIDVGFEAGGVVVTTVDRPPLAGGAAAPQRFWRGLVEAVAALPSTESVTLADRVPFEVNVTTMAVTPEGEAPPAGAGWPVVEWAVVGEGYFQTLRIPLLEGRDFAPRDDQASPRPAIVNDVFARRFWPARRAVGAHFRDREGARHQVVGVVRHVKHLTLGEEPKPYVYLPLAGTAAPTMNVIARGRLDEATFLREVRAAIRRREPAAPLYAAETLSRRMRLAFLPASAAAAVVNALALLALALTSLGLYATVAQVVGGRRYEIGLRRALGAPDRHVVRLVVEQTALVVGVGAGAGMALGWLCSRLVGGLLYGVSAHDPWVFGLAPTMLVLVALAATWMPARRASRIEPAIALRRV